jgi:hypothetical protein
LEVSISLEGVRRPLALLLASRVVVCVLCNAGWVEDLGLVPFLERADSWSSPYRCLCLILRATTQTWEWVRRVKVVAIIGGSLSHHFLLEHPRGNRVVLPLNLDAAAGSHTSLLPSASTR